MNLVLAQKPFTQADVSRMLSSIFCSLSLLSMEKSRLSCKQVAEACRTSCLSLCLSATKSPHAKALKCPTHSPQVQQENVWETRLLLQADALVKPEGNPPGHQGRAQGGQLALCPLDALSCCTAHASSFLSSNAHTPCCCYLLPRAKHSLTQSHVFCTSNTAKAPRVLEPTACAARERLDLASGSASNCLRQAHAAH